MRKKEREREKVKEERVAIVIVCFSVENKRVLIKFGRRKGTQTRSGLLREECAISMPDKGC